MDRKPPRLLHNSLCTQLRSNPQISGFEQKLTALEMLSCWTFWRRYNRGKDHMSTPDVFQVCSKRSFDGQVCPPPSFNTHPTRVHLLYCGSGLQAMNKGSLGTVTWTSVVVEHMPTTELLNVKAFTDHTASVNTSLQSLEQVYPCPQLFGNENLLDRCYCCCTHRLWHHVLWV